MGGLFVTTHGAWLITFMAFLLSLLSFFVFVFICFLHIKAKKEIDKLVIFTKKFYLLKLHNAFILTPYK